MNIRSAALAVLMLALVGCSKLTLENYDKIAVGMKYEDVVKLIGEPDHCDDLMGVRSCQWGDKNRSINVNFVGGKVLLFSSTNLK